MDLDALLQSLLATFKDNPTMVLLLTVGFFFLKQMFPTPAPASTQVIQGYAERIRMALLAGNEAGAKQLADAGIAKTAELLRVETEPKPKGILDIFTGLFTGGNMLPLLIMGGVLMLFVFGGNGCKKTATAVPPASALTWQDSALDETGALTVNHTHSQGVLPHVRNAVFNAADPVGVWSVAAGDYEWADYPGPGDDGAAVHGPNCRGNGSANAGTRGPVAVPGAAVASCRAGACVSPGGQGRQGVGRYTGRRAWPVASAARLAGRPVARVAVGVVRVFRWARPVRRAAAWLCGRRG
jgi:hypothetical protein